MAVVPWTVVTTAVDGQNVKLVKWENLGAGDTGQPFVVAPYSDKTVQLVTATSVTIQGSNDPDGSAYHTLNDPQGTALANIASDKTEAVLEHTYLLRPSGQCGTVWLLLGSTR